LALAVSRGRSRYLPGCRPPGRAPPPRGRLTPQRRPRSAGH